MEFLISDRSIWLTCTNLSVTDLLLEDIFSYLIFRESYDEESVSPVSLLTETQRERIHRIEMTTEEFYDAQVLGQKYAKLSRHAMVAVAISKNRNIPILSDDSELQKVALKEKIQLVDLSGLLDYLYNKEAISKKRLAYYCTKLRLFLSRDSIKALDSTYSPRTKGGGLIACEQQKKNA